MFKKMLLILAYVSLVACQPSPIQQTATYVLAQAQTQTAAPTLTLTPTLSPTPTDTSTPIPTSTPLGGGNGTLLFPRNPFQGLSPSASDGIYIIGADGSNIKQFLSRSQIETLIGYPYNRAIYIAVLDHEYILTDTSLHSLSSDLKISNSLDLTNKVFIDFSPDGKMILYIGSDHALYISTVDGTETRQIAVGDTRFYNAWWSAEEDIIYYERFQGRNTWAVKSDGSDKHELDFGAITNYTPWNNYKNPTFELEGGDPSNVQWAQRFDTYAVSPDKDKVAFTWQNLLFTIKATDTEFSTPHLITEIPNDAHKLVWSPNGDFLIIGLRNFEGGFGNSVLIDMISKQIKTVFSSNGNEEIPCGFSPDGNQISFFFENWSTKVSGIKLVSLDGNSSKEIVQLEGQVWCPTWR